MYKFAIAQAVLAMMLIGLVPILVKWIEADIVVIGIGRLVVGYLFITLFTVLVYRKPPRMILAKQLRGPLAIIGLLFGLHWVTYFLSIKLSTPSIAVIGLSTYGMHLLLYGRLILKEPLSLVGVASIGLAIIGNFLVVPSLSLEDDMTLGLLVGICSGAVYALLPVYFRLRPNISVEEKTQGQFFYALMPFVVLLPWSNWDIPTGDWWVIIFMGVACTGIGHACWVHASTVLPTRLTSALFYVSIPFTILFSTLFLGESQGWKTLFGAALIILANLLAVFFKRTSP